MSAQEFVNLLNEREMPALGYVKVDGKWRWPVYDFSSYDVIDFDKSSRAISAKEVQHKRIGKMVFE